MSLARTFAWVAAIALLAGSIIDGLARDRASAAPAPPEAGAAGPAGAQDPLLGDLLFHSPQVLGKRAQAMQLSCERCHPNGLTNSTFFIAGLSDRPGNIDLKSGFFLGAANRVAGKPINIPSLRGLLHTPPYGRDGRIGVLRVFIDNVITAEFGGQPLPLHQLRALTAYVEGLDFLPNDLLDKGGALSASAPAAARRGETLFRTTFAGLGNRSCADCHQPQHYFTDGKIHPRPADAAGSRLALKTPPLLGLVDTAPYFHDGSLARIADVVGWYDRTYHLALSSAREADLVAYLTAVGSTAGVAPASERDIILRSARYLSLLETGPDAEDRGVWEKALSFASSTATSIKNGSSDVDLAALRHKVAATQSALASGAALDTLRPEVEALRRRLIAAADREKTPAALRATAR